MSGFNHYTTSGFTPPQNPPALLSWQQRRPAPGAHKRPSSSPSNGQVSPPSPAAVAAPMPSSDLSIPSLSSSPPRSSVSSSSFPAPSVPSISTPPNKVHRQSLSSLPSTLSTIPPRHNRSGSAPKGMPGTFAPNFIKSADERRNSAASLGAGIAGEGSDFSGRRWVWVRDPEKAFVKGEVVLDEDGTLTVRCDDGAVRIPKKCCWIFVAAFLVFLVQLYLPA